MKCGLYTCLQNSAFTHNRTTLFRSSNWSEDKKGPLIVENAGSENIKKDSTLFPSDSLVNPAKSIVY